MTARPRIVTEWLVEWRREGWSAGTWTKSRRYASRQAALAFIARLRWADKDCGTVQINLRRRRATFSPWADAR